MRKKGRKKKNYKARMIAEASLKISAVALALCIGGKFALSYAKDAGYFNIDDINRFLNIDTSVEQQDENYVDEELNNEISDSEISNTQMPEEEAKEEESSEDVANALPYPDIIPEVDYESTSNELAEMGVEIPSINWEKVNEINEDANAWIYIPGVGPKDGISLPVVQGTDNEYYLHHDIEGNKDSRGTLFIDWRNNPLDSETQELSDVTCIYGHKMSSGAMFAPISNYKSQTFYDRHPYGVIIAENGEVYKLDFFAGVIADGSNELNIYASDFIDESQFNAYFDNIVSNSTFQSDCKVEFGDKIVLLQTCSYEYDGAKYLLYGRLTKQLINEQEVQSTLGR